MDSLRCAAALLCGKKRFPFLFSFCGIGSKVNCKKSLAEALDHYLDDHDNKQDIDTCNNDAMI
jgi:hypothetical protein